MPPTASSQRAAAATRHPRPATRDPPEWLIGAHAITVARPAEASRFGGMGLVMLHLLRVVWHDVREAA